MITALFSMNNCTSLALSCQRLRDSSGQWFLTFKVHRIPRELVTNPFLRPSAPDVLTLVFQWDSRIWSFLGGFFSKMLSQVLLDPWKIHVRRWTQFLLRLCLDHLNLNKFSMYKVLSNCSIDDF